MPPRRSKAGNNNKKKKKTADANKLPASKTPVLDRLRKRFVDTDFDNVDFAVETLHPQSAVQQQQESPFRVCAWMIVRDEEDHVENTLRSAASAADCFVVGDTGSKDKTIEKVIAVCADLKKPLYLLQLARPKYEVEFPWFNFAAYRNRVLRLAEILGVWLLALDASDEVRNGEALGQILDRVPDHIVALGIRIQWNDSVHTFQRLLRASARLRYRGARHNYVDLGKAPQGDVRDMPFSVYQDRTTAKSSAAKYYIDVEYFEWLVKIQPTDARAAYYLANALKDCSDSIDQDDKKNAAKKQKLARRAYDAFVASSQMVDQWVEQIYMAHFTCGLLALQLRLSLHTIERHFTSAYNCIATPLAAIELYRLYEALEYHNQAHVWITAACTIGEPRLSLQEKPRYLAENRWEFLAVSATHMRNPEMAVAGYVRAQKGHLKYRTLEEEATEDMLGIPFYSNSLEWVWDRYSESKPTLLDSVPEEFMSKSLHEKVVKKKKEEEEKANDMEREEEKEKKEEEEPKEDDASTTASISTATASVLSTESDVVDAIDAVTKKEQEKTDDKKETRVAADIVESEQKDAEHNQE